MSVGILINLAGRRFGRLTVLTYSGSVRTSDGKPNGALWLCSCDCGNSSVVPSLNLRRGDTASCGCLASELANKRSTKHGRHNTVEYRAWRGMIERCCNENGKSFPDYGGRGIKICAQWRKSFASFFSDMGARPKDKTSLDRYPDNNGNYEPTNCRWATAKEQANNRRNNVATRPPGDYRQRNPRRIK